jgi:Amt family ammonium transporter
VARALQRWRKVPHDDSVKIDDLTAWGVVATALVMVVPYGFALLASGFSRARNVIHTLVGVVVLYSVAVLGYWAVGFAVQSHGALFLRSMTASSPELGRFPFLVVLSTIPVVISVGALAERWTFPSMMAVGLAVSTTIYPLVARWVWGGGWLAGLGRSSGFGHGVVDFAGSGVVHLVGGLVALAGAVVVGPRLRKFARDGRPTAMPGHHVPMFMAGSLILGVGWFGVVLGMWLPIPGASLALAATNTVIASAASIVSATIYMLWRFGTPDPSLVANAWLAGLVSISAGCAFVSSWAAACIGIVSGPLVIQSVLGLERLRVDDPAGAVSIHGLCGAWGVLAVGLLANGQNGDGLNGVAGPVRGLFYGDAFQFLAQALGAGVMIVFVFGTSYAIYQVLGRIIGNRVPVTAELEGLDAAELGTTAYPDFGVLGAPHDSRQ